MKKCNQVKAHGKKGARLPPGLPGMSQRASTLLWYSYSGHREPSCKAWVQQWQLQVQGAETRAYTPTVWKRSDQSNIRKPRTMRRTAERSGTAVESKNEALLFGSGSGVIALLVQQRLLMHPLQQPRFLQPGHNHQPGHRQHLHPQKPYLVMDLRSQTRLDPKG